MDYIKHYSMGGTLISHEVAEYWLERLPSLIKKHFSDCDVLIYQAGADCHIDDPLGGIFTTEQLKRRDRIVFETCKEIGLPVAWNLAGGYQKPIRNVLDIHDNTAKECIDVYESGEGRKAVNE